MFNHSKNLIVTGGTFNQMQVTMAKDPFERLQEATSPSVFHDSGDRRDPPKCYPNTRCLDPDTMNALVLWFHDPAGAGKSAIAQSIAKAFAAEGGLLASYFFSRFDPTRNHPRFLVPTIAYQVSLHFPDVRNLVEDAIRADPLLMQPIIESGYFDNPANKRLLIIDGLDECEDRDGQVDILRSISTALQQHRLPLIFLIASRPEHDITNAFSSINLHNISTRLPLDNIYSSSADIEIFLRGKFADIKSNHPFKTRIPSEWPPDIILEFLLEKSSGQFVYAATVMRFVASIRHLPTTRLEIALGLWPSPGGRNIPFAELDALYRHVLNSSEDVDALLQVLALAILWTPDVEVVEAVLSLDPGEVETLLCDALSVVYIQKRGTPPVHASELIQTYHASLRDFVFDKSRSQALYIDAPARHAQFLQNALQYLKSHRPWKVLLKMTSHLHQALPTAEISQTVANASIEQLIQSGIEFIPIFLSAIRHSQFPNAEEIYNTHSQAFHRSLKQRLKVYYCGACAPVAHGISHFHAHNGCMKIQELNGR
ncbi:hypothetical protein CPB84DRAFT_1796218 [Gymnopilus junonius]|uniref:Nephrocystin 3-like N-terminal domain-containing protein n=1 Tax=Gymnopilus junonius TaxID=109634 RepID=A0A9P5N960_GYMJU|nr:hypothetical protein CPB84DRAFT_1796218 [Gymnopilus junonius]